jgi:hypothetical protein
MAMGVALKLYEQLTDAGEDKNRARLIAEAFERLEERYPELKEVATQGHVRESELRLQKEIQGVRLEIKEVEARLKLEIKEVESRLAREIKELDVKMTASLHRQTLWVVGSVGAIIGLIRLMDFFLHSGVAH